jgi:DNA-binding LytR/AlgR family response regulator
MLNPFLENTPKTVQYVLLWLLYALLQSFVVYTLASLPLHIILLDGFVHAMLYGVIGVLIRNIVKYGNYSVLGIYQRIINYVALALLSIGLCLSVGFGLFYYCFDASVSNQLMHLLPLKAFVGLLIYLLIIQQFQLEMMKSGWQELVADECNDKEKMTSMLTAPAVEALERITVKSGTKIHVVLVPDIIYLQADGDYVQIFSTDGKYLKEQTMKYFEEHLPANQFVRVHRSVIVNVEKISRIELYEKQNQLLTLKNGDKIKTSQAGYKALRTVLNM